MNLAITPFVPFSGQHGVAVALGLVAVAAFIVAGRRGGNSQRLATALLAFLNLAAYPLGQAAWWSLDYPKALENIVPLHLCDIAAFTAGFALITRHRLLIALTYFWGLAATLQALVTPALGIGYPHLPYVMFFVHHFAVVAAALYFPLALGWRPTQPWWKSPLVVYAWSLLYLAVAITANTALGTNFGFLARPPDNPSLIDHLGPWPFYLLSFQVLGLAFFYLLALPFARRHGN